MPIKRMQVKRWEQAIEAGDKAVQDLSFGPSPGAAAATLGITRQAVHLAIRRGDLEALAVYRGERLLFYTITPASLARFQQIRSIRRRA